MVFFGAVFILLISCRYEEGPALSFRKVNNRLQGFWEIKNFNVNGVDCTNVYFDKCSCNYSFSNVRDTYYLSFIDCRPDGRTIYGSYDFKDNKNVLIFNMAGLGDFKDTTLSWDSPVTYFGPIGTMKFSEWNILKLKNQEMKLESNYEGSYYVLDLIKTSKQ